MARFDTSGLDPVLAKLQQMGELTGTVAQEMLTAGAEIVKTSGENPPNGTVTGTPGT